MNLIHKAYRGYWRLRKRLRVGIVDEQNFVKKDFAVLHKEAAIEFPSNEVTIQKDSFGQIGYYAGQSFELRKVGYQVFKNVNLVGSAAITVSQSGTVFLQSTLLNINIVKNSGSIRVSAPFLERPITVERAISIVNLYNINGQFNYFHWVNDSMIGLEALFHLQKDKISPIKVIVPPNINSVQKDYLKLLGVAPEHQIPWHGKRMIVKELLIHSTNRNPAQPMDVLHPGPYVWLQSRVMGQLEKDDRKNKRIFISRQRSKGRRFSNEKDLKRWLEKNRITEVFLEELPLLEQLSLFYHAETIVAPHGAGFTNIFMCRKKTNVFEIHGNPAGGFSKKIGCYTEFYRLSFQFNLKYHFVSMEWDEKGDEKDYRKMDLIFNADSISFFSK